jgi:hypothetical protein
MCLDRIVHGGENILLCGQELLAFVQACESVGCRNSRNVTGNIRCGQKCEWRPADRNIMGAYAHPSV